MKVTIAPSIIASDFTRLREEITTVEKAGCDVIHVDIMDGQFVPQLTIGEIFVKMLKQNVSVPVDLHFMVINPEKVIPRFFDYRPNSITFHFEATDRVADLIASIKDQDIKPGISLKPETSADALMAFLPRLHNVLVMSVEPGFSGQKFMPESLPKIRRLVELREETGSTFSIWLDGGVNMDTVAHIAGSGVDYVVMGNGIFKSPDYGVVIQKIRDTFA